MATKKAVAKKAVDKKAAPKKATEKSERKPRDSAAQLIKDELRGGIENVDTIVNRCAKRFPDTKVTRGYVRWLARSIGLGGQIAADVSKKAAPKKAAPKKAALKTAGSKKKVGKVSKPARAPGDEDADFTSGWGGDDNLI